MVFVQFTSQTCIHQDNRPLLCTLHMCYVFYTILSGCVLKASDLVFTALSRATNTRLCFLLLGVVVKSTMPTLFFVTGSSGEEYNANTIVPRP